MSSKRNFVDLQVNGYKGIDFNSAELSLADIERAAEEMMRDGVLHAFPTVITNSVDHMSRCLSNLANAIDNSPIVAECFKGLHIEGPFLNNTQGFIGAHPPHHALEADEGALNQLLEACQGKAKILTIAPENDPNNKLIELATEQNLVVAAGHTDASREQLEAAIAAGLSLFTHLGNGCPQQMHRHDNIITRVLSLADQLSISVIADGHHLPADLFRLFIKIIPVEKLIVVSDATSAAGLGPGKYQLAGREIEVTSDGCAVDPELGNFLGSAQTLQQAQGWLRDEIKIPLETELHLMKENAQRLMGL